MNEQSEKAEPIIEWPCACVKRNRNGDLSHIKINAARVKRCRKCGCKRPEFPLYRCPACGKVMERQSTKRWMVSYCETTGRDARIQRVSDGDWSFRVVQE